MSDPSALGQLLFVESDSVSDAGSLKYDQASDPLSLFGHSARLLHSQGG